MRFKTENMLDRMRAEFIRLPLPLEGYAAATVPKALRATESPE
jgi:hypothetical protein